MNDHREAFLREGDEHARRLRDALEALEADPGDEAAMNAVFRSAHTLKGNLAATGFADARDLAHAVEDLLDAMRRGGVDVTAERMDRAFDAVDELEACLDDVDATGDVQRDVSDAVASVRAALDEPGADAAAGAGAGTVIEAGDGSDGEAMGPPADAQRESAGGDGERVDASADGDLLDETGVCGRNAASDVRRVPLADVAGKFRRLVRGLAREQGKEVEFVVTGGDVELDRRVLATVGDPLLHLLRNAVDHGVEPPEVRAAAGKDREGTVAVSAERYGDRVVVQVRDDGAGIDRERVRERAVEAGIRSRAEVQELSDAAVEDLVFDPRLSTNDEVTAVSGRGVGLDVVRETVSRLGGRVSASSVSGAGTTFTMTLPATAAVESVLVVESDGEAYGVPADAVVGLSEPETVERVDGEAVVTSDEATYPVVRLTDALNLPDGAKNADASGDDGEAGCAKPANDAGDTSSAGTPNDGGDASSEGTPNHADRTRDDGVLVRVRDGDRRFAVHCGGVRGRSAVAVTPLETGFSGSPGLAGVAVLAGGDAVTLLDVSEL